jgi:hypothetical protein
MTNIHLNLFHTQYHNDIRQIIGDYPLFVNIANASLTLYRRRYQGQIGIWNGRIEGIFPSEEGIDIWIVINYMMIH